MSFEDFKNSVISDKVVLFEISKGEELSDLLWEKYVPGVWKATYYWEEGRAVDTFSYGVGMWGAGEYGLPSSSTLPPSENVKSLAIVSMEINGVFYSAANSIDEVQTNNNTFYFDIVDQVLYVNYEGYIQDPNNVIVTGKTKGYANKAITMDGVVFEPRISTMSSISVNRDNLFKSIATFSGGDVSMINDDKGFSDFGNLDVYGQAVEIKLGTFNLEYEDFEQIYKGKIDRFGGNNRTFSIKVRDDRKSFEQNIPNKSFDTDIYPDLGDFNVGVGIGIGYGIVKRAIPVCTNEKEITSTYNFKFVDTSYHEIESIDEVYVDGIKVAFANGSTVNGTFDLPSSLYTSGQEVEVDFHGYVDDLDVLIDNPLSIIEDLIYLYEDIVYGPLFYNVQEWDFLKTLTSAKIGLYVKDSRQLVDVITNISMSILGTFIVQDDGKYNIKVVDRTKAINRRIKYAELLATTNEVPQFDTYISSAKIGYLKNNATGEYAYYTNIDDEPGLIKRFRQNKQQIFLTDLSDRDSAIDFSAEAMALYGGMFNQYTVVTGIQNIDLDIEDIIDVEVEQFNDGSFKNVICSVIGKSFNMSGNDITMTFTVREINTIATPSTYGALYGIGNYGTNEYGETGSLTNNDLKQ